MTGMLTFSIMALIICGLSWGLDRSLYKMESGGVLGHAGDATVRADLGGHPISSRTLADTTIAIRE